MGMYSTKRIVIIARFTSSFFFVAAHLTFILNLLLNHVALGSKRSILCNNIIGSFPTQPHVFFFFFVVAVTNAQRIYDICITTHDK